MKVPVSLLALALGFGLTLPAAPEAEASFGGIQRCRAVDGTAVYTDKPCAAFNATPDAMSDDLGMRLASEAAREPAPTGDDAVATDAIAATGPAVGRRSLLAGCARTPTQLAMDVQGSIALGDVNRLAESWHWVGMTQKQATPVMVQLERLTRGRMATARYFDAQMGYGLQLASSDAAMQDGRAGLMELQLSGEGARPVQLNVERYAGCYFVHF